jgi:hypothetical protein
VASLLPPRDVLGPGLGCAVILPVSSTATLPRPRLSRQNHSFLAVGLLVGRDPGYPSETPLGREVRMLLVQPLGLNEV